jgi:hypothetical protein
MGCSTERRWQAPVAAGGVTLMTVLRTNFHRLRSTGAARFSQPISFMRILKLTALLLVIAAFGPAHATPAQRGSAPATGHASYAAVPVNPGLTLMHAWAAPLVTPPMRAIGEQFNIAANIVAGPGTPYGAAVSFWANAAQNWTRAMAGVASR